MIELETRLRALGLGVGEYAVLVQDPEVAEAVARALDAQRRVLLEEEREHAPSAAAAYTGRYRPWASPPCPGLDGTPCGRPAIPGGYCRECNEQLPF